MQSDTPTTPFGRRSLMLAHMATGTTASSRPPETLADNERFARNRAGPEIEFAFAFDLPPLVVRSEEFEIQSLAANRRNGAPQIFRDPILVRAMRRLQSRSPKRTGGR